MARPKNLRGGRKPRTATPATQKITVRLTDEERARIEDEAARHATTPGALMRDRALRQEEPSGGADAEADRLRAALAETEAAIANEQGRGEPPAPGWVAHEGHQYDFPRWVNASLGCHVLFTRLSGSTAPKLWGLFCYGHETTWHPTARAAMHAAADLALAGGGS